MKQLITFLLFICSITFSYGQDFEKVEIKSEKIADNIYMLEGRGGNIAVSAGAEGVFMIDSQFGPLSEKIAAAIQKISDQPIKYLFNTHWHGDHTGGNENFSKKGVTIVAQENVRTRMKNGQVIQAFGRKVEPAVDIALPTITFKDDITFHLNGEQVYAFHTHNAHTDGDAIVYFMTSNVIHLGDTYFNGKYPFYDVSSGGSIDGMIKSANQVLFLIKEDTKVIPGHGKLSNKKELTAYRDVLIAVSDKVKKAIADGKTIEEIKAAKLTKEYDAEWGQGFIKPDKFVDIIWTDLTRGKDKEK